MKHITHPAVQVIRDEIAKKKLTYAEVAALTGMKPARLRNILSGRISMKIEDRDTICFGLDMFPVEIIMQREDLTDSKGFIDIRKMPEALQDAFRLITDALTGHSPSSSGQDATET